MPKPKTKAKPKTRLKPDRTPWRSKVKLPRVTERDMEMLRWVGSQLAATTAQLEVLHKGHPTNVRKWRYKFERSGLMRSAQIFPDRPAYVWLTRRGIYHADLPYKAVEPPISKLRHIEASGWARLLCVQNELGEWTPERELARQKGLRRAEANAQERKRIAKEHRCDAELLTEDGERMAIEVELNRKSKRHLQERVRAVFGVPGGTYGERCYDEVWFFAPPKLTRALVSDRSELANEHPDGSIYEDVKVYQLPDRSAFA